MSNEGRRVALAKAIAETVPDRFPLLREDVRRYVGPLLATFEREVREERKGGVQGTGGPPKPALHGPSPWPPAYVPPPQFCACGFCFDHRGRCKGTPAPDAAIPEAALAGGEP